MVWSGLTCNGTTSRHHQEEEEEAWCLVLPVPALICFTLCALTVSPGSAEERLHARVWVVSAGHCEDWWWCDWCDTTPTSVSGLRHRTELMLACW